MGAGYQAFDHGYRVMSGINAQASEYKMYQGAVYEPFNNTPPSESGESAIGISGRKNLGGMDGHDPGNQSPNSPMGEPFVLLLFAAVAALFVARRQRQTA